MSDHNSENRKKDHIGLAFESQAGHFTNDSRFYYEPLLQAHPQEAVLKTDFLGKSLRFPLWISSMTGGTAMAGKINQHLARACSEFGIGMGLGSCRSLLYADTYFEDFNLRPLIGKDLPFFANLGIAQVEKLVRSKETGRIADLLGKLQADGLIIHVNPLQEFLQPEGDRFGTPPLETISSLLGTTDFPIIVKEVGQGMGPESLEALLQLPLAAIDFGAYGGTNFSKLELLRSGDDKTTANEGISHIGHTAGEMVGFVNNAVEQLGSRLRCRQIIISGGIRDFTDGYYYMHKINLSAIYAQGSAMLRHAQNNYEELKTYIQSQVEGLALCEAYLKVKSEK